MKNYLLTIISILALSIGAIAQTTVVDFETVQDPRTEPFDLKEYEIAVANPDKTAPNTSDFVGKAVKQIDPDGNKWWGGTNISFGGEIDLTGSDIMTIDCYAEQAGPNDTINFRVEVIDEFSGNPTVAIDGFYTDATDTDVNVWKTISYDLSGLSGSYTKIVIFFNWIGHAQDGDVYYFDNITLPGYTPFGNADVTFNITDKFNNATDVGLFIDGVASTLTQTDNVYSVTESLASYNVTLGASVGVYEIVYTHMANGVEVRDTATLLCGNVEGTQELIQLIIVEEEEDGTATAVNVGTTPPTIDGTIDDVWDNAKTHTLQERSWWGSPTGLYTQWKIMWDIENVYLLYIVEDATLQNTNTTNVYENDCIETFFDMNQSASAGYDADDWQIRSIRGLDTWTGSANVDDTWGADIERAQVETTDPVGYVIEMAIPWTSISGTFLPLDGKEFNYDVCVADVTATLGTRAFREAWTTNIDNAYNNTTLFGTVTLTDATSEFTAIRDVSQIPNLSIYPNPVIDRLNIQASNIIKDVEVYDIMGRQALKMTNIYKGSFVMDVNELDKNAIYIVRLKDIQGNVSSRKITVQ
ncbi:MAG: hypothetical protein C0597_10205 [Marinilabiliales bacterium]|nr:MAG: hypothetical protein C0597_10205 [Marinilabiliales bacterium]